MCRCLLFSSLLYTAVIRKTSEYKIKDKIMQNIKLKRNFSICAVWEFYYTNKRKEYWKDLCSKRNSKNETQKRKHAKQNQYQSRWGTAKPLGICCSWHSITLPLFFWKKTSKLPFCRFFYPKNINFKKCFIFLIHEEMNSALRKMILQKMQFQLLILPFFTLKMWISKNCFIFLFLNWIEWFISRNLNTPVQAK